MCEYEAMEPQRPREGCLTDVVDCQSVKRGQPLGGLKCESVKELTSSESSDGVHGQGRRQVRGLPEKREANDGDGVERWWSPPDQVA